MLKRKGLKRVLICLMGSIGDVARGISVANHIKKEFPSSAVAWLVEPKSKDLILNTPAVDKVITFERGGGLSAILKALREVRAFKPEVTLDLQRHIKSALFTFFSGADIRVGFHPFNSKELNWIFQTHFIGFFPETSPKLNAYLDFLRVLGIEKPKEVEFGLKPPPAAESILAILPEGLKVGVVVGSTWETKNWPTLGYIDLLKDLSRNYGLGFVLLGDKSQVKIAGQIESAVASKKLVNLVGKTKLLEAISIIPHLDLLIGPDSGPGHIAASLGVRQVTVFGPTAPERVAPYNGESLVVKASVPCSPCLRKRCPGLENICMRSISAQMVKEKVLKALPF